MQSSSLDTLALIPIWYVAFLFSTVCHEAAHALVARWGGDSTAYAGGQVSLDPLPHIRREPFGMVVVPLAMLFTSGMIIGWGSAPYDPYWQIRYPRRAALMALAGPATNFLLAITAALILRLGLLSGFFIFGAEGGPFVSGADGAFLEALGVFLGALFLLNVILGVFNLLPFPPLDGYSVLGLILPEDITLKLLQLARSPGFSMFGLVLAWQLSGPLIRFVVPFAHDLLLYGL